MFLKQFSVLAVFILISCILQIVNSQDTNSTTPIPPGDECSIVNGTCADCISFTKTKCLFCQEDNTCRKLEFDGLFPKGCKLSKARWSVCFLDLQALIIAVSVVAGVIIVIIICCICYCCNKTCHSITNARLSRIERKIQKDRAKREAEREIKRAERQKNYDAIRVKYGLKSGKSYAQMDDN